MSRIRLGHNGFLYSLSCAFEAKNTRVTCDYSPFDPTSGRINQPSHLSLSLPGRYRLVSCRVVSDLSTGMEVPAMVLRRKISTTTKPYMYCFVSVGFSDQMEVCGSFMLNGKLDSKTCWPICGPRVVFIEAGVMHMTACKPSAVGVFDCIPMSDSTLKVLVDVSYSSHTYLICAGTLCPSSQLDTGTVAENRRQDDLVFVTFHSDELTGRLISCDLHRHTIMLLYFPHMTKLKILNLEIDDTDKDKSAQSFYGGMELDACRYQTETRMIVVTDSCQVLILQDGSVSDVVNLPTSTGDLTSLESWFGWKSQEFAAVLTSTGDVYVISLKSSEVVSHYSAVVELHVSDFLGNGTQQCLLVHQAEGEPCSPQMARSEFTLIDGIHCWFSPQKQGDAEFKEDGAAESIMRAQRALSLRLQSSFHDVDAQYRQSSMMGDLIQDSMNLLSRMAMNQKSTNETPHTNLLPLLGGESDRKNKSFLGHVPAEKAPICVTDKWQKVVDNHWVIGLEIINDTDNVFHNVRLVSCCKHPDGEEESISKLVKITSLPSDFKSLVTHPAVPAKKQKMDVGIPHVEVVHHLGPKEKATQVSMRKIPDFCASERAQVDLLVAWNEKLVNSDMEDLKSSHPAKLWLAGKLEINTHEIISSEICLIPRRQITIKDILALTAYQVTITMVLTTVYSSSRSLQQCLESPLEFDFLASFDQWLCGRPGPLYFSRVSISKQTLRACDLLLFVRDTAQFFHLLHALYDALPDDVTILQPNDDSNLFGMISNVLHHMESELRHSSRSLQNIISEWEKTDTESQQMKDNFDVKTKHQQFKDQQQQFHQKHDSVVSSEMLANFNQKLEIKQRNTNDALLKMGLVTQGNK